MTEKEIAPKKTGLRWLLVLNYFSWVVFTMGMVSTTLLLVLQDYLTLSENSTNEGNLILFTVSIAFSIHCIFLGGGFSVLSEYLKERFHSEEE